MDQKTQEIFSLILIEFEKACRKHPEFPSHSGAAVSIITEEFLELVRAVNDGDAVNHQIEEAAHVAVTAMRFIETKIKDER